jgi:transaldolase
MVKPMNPLLELTKQGQSIWLDYIRRSFLTGGGLQRLIESDGVTGVTSNPAIFEKAIDDSADYDDVIRSLLAVDPRMEAKALYDRLSLEDVRMTADMLRPIYDRTGGADGYVSLEPPPQSTRNVLGTIEEAHRLRKAVGRPNLMIKVVATQEGISAVEALIAEGINVNITLMFSLRHYEAVANAYIRGLRRCPEPSKVASVASFFVSRVDTQVDRKLDSNGSPEALALRGKVAIANAKITYRQFQEIFCGGSFAALRQRGARVQRPLWASTGSKNPDYSDVLYIEDLIGRDTVSTIPPATLDAFREHGRVKGATILDGVPNAEDQLRHLAALGIDLGVITENLQTDGVIAFASAYDRVLAALERKRQSILARDLRRETA